ncbi:hypothetical protein PR202_gb01108 [Eleusine coracana subsp. coracana]|uniref:Uncharacterized protein n=1 Tax=Eleusine coracana subsp. coracana TaxID=191504 RepID=A0AAV5DVG1_ELECO|nr:hypothetical protein PR202_gb01108 [Eleusine coracana subsp. coracana]
MTASFAAAVEKTKEGAAAAAAEEGELEGMPPEFYDEQLLFFNHMLLDFHMQEWQAHRRERTKEWHAYRQKEEAEEDKRTNEYREIGMRLKAYPQEEVRKARILVSSFIRAGEDIEEEIEKAAERGDLTELVLMVIWNRLDIARRDDERDAIRSLDLLYRRVEAEILKSEATPAMRLLNELLHLHDGSDDNKWLKKCRNRMLEVFPREDPFTMVFPAGFHMEKEVTVKSARGRQSEHGGTAGGTRRRRERQAWRRAVGPARPVAVRGKLDGSAGGERAATRAELDGGVVAARGRQRSVVARAMSMAASGGASRASARAELDGGAGDEHDGERWV